MSMSMSMGRPMTATTSSVASEVEHQQENHELQVQQQLVRGNADQQHRQNHQFSCLYTHQKNKKRKTWQDGKFVLQSHGHGMLYVANPPPGSGNPCLAELELPHAEVDSLLRRHQTLVESEKYLIQLEEIWSEPTRNISQTSAKPVVSNGMQKLLTKKFRKPRCFVPPNPSQHPPSHAASNLARRRRPLQPGELVRQHYGSEATTSIRDEQPHPTQHLDANAISSGRAPVNSAPSTMSVQPQILQNGQEQRQQVYPSAETHSAATAHQQPRLPQNNSKNSGWGNNYANLPNSQLTLATVNPQMQQETLRQSNSFNSATHEQQQSMSAIQNRPQPLTTSTKALQQFARNSFDPNQFYGFEEDDEDDEEDSDSGQHFVGGDWFAPQTTNTDKGDNHTCNDTNFVPRRVTPTGDQDCPSFQTIVLPDKAYVPKTDTTTDTADVGVASSSNTMTDADLLDLFGGSDSFHTQNHDDNKQQEDNVELDEGGENVESTRASCPEQIGDWTLAVEERGGRNASTNREAHKNTNADNEFVLPPSESSSDESSDDEDSTKQ